MFERVDEVGKTWSNWIMFCGVDDSRIEENRARARLGVLLVAPALAVGLLAEVLLPGAGVIFTCLTGLLSFLVVGAGHTALERAREGIAAQAWAARILAALYIAARRAQASTVRLCRLLARRRARLSLPRLAAGVSLTPRLLPVPRARPA